MDRGGEMTPAAGKKPKQRRRRWRPDEHQRFLEALQMFGRDWKMIEEHVGTRTTLQLRSHAQKYFENARKLGVTGLPPPRPMRRRKHAKPQQPQSSTAGQPPPDMQNFDWASISGTSASAWLNHGGAETQTEQVAAAYPGRDDNSFMGTASFFSAMTMDMEWAGTSSATEAPPSSLPEPDFNTMLAGDEAELDPWDVIMQEIKDIGLELDLDLSIPDAAGGSECGAAPPHHGIPVVSDQPETSMNRDGACSPDVRVDGKGSVL